MLNQAKVITMQVLIEEELPDRGETTDFDEIFQSMEMGRRERVLGSAIGEGRSLSPKEKLAEKLKNASPGGGLAKVAKKIGMKEVTEDTLK